MVTIGNSSSQKPAELFFSTPQTRMKSFVKKVLMMKLNEVSTQGYTAVNEIAMSSCIICGVKIAEAILYNSL